MTVRFLAEAEVEFDEAIAHYDAQLPGLGHDFASEVQIVSQEYNNFPHHGRFSAREFAATACGVFRMGSCTQYLVPRSLYWLLCTYIGGRIIAKSARASCESRLMAKPNFDLRYPR